MVRLFPELLAQIPILNSELPSFGYCLKENILNF